MSGRGSKKSQNGNSFIYLTEIIGIVFSQKESHAASPAVKNALLAPSLDVKGVLAK